MSSEMIQVDYDVLQGVPAHMLEDVWPVVWPMLEKVFAKLDVAKYYEEKDIYKAIEERQMQLWVVVEDSKIKASIVTQFINYPRWKALDVMLVGGEDVQNCAIQVWNTLKQYARSHKADGIRGFGRPGWLRVLKIDAEPSIIWEVDL